MNRALSIIIGTTLEDNPVAHHFVSLARTLAGRGHRVVLLTPHRKVDLEDHNSNPAIYTWPSERPTRLRDGIFLWRLSRRYRPDIFIANFSAVNLMCLVGSVLRVPCRVAWYHTVTAAIDQDHPKPFWKRTLLQLRKGLVYRSATHFVANSHACAADLQQIFHVPPRKCKVFYNSLADPLHAKELLNCSPIPDRLLCVGRLFPSKGQDVLLRALAMLEGDYPGLHLDLIGKGPAQAEYEALAKSLGIGQRCTFHGRLPHPEVLRCMRQATVVVSPTHHDAFGLVNLEAMAVGTPVIASGVGGVREVVRDGMDGFLVPAGDPPRLAEQLRRVLSNHELRNRLGAQARERFLSRFEQKRIVRQQLRWLESLSFAASEACGSEVQS